MTSQQQIRTFRIYYFPKPNVRAEVKLLYSGETVEESIQKAIGMLEEQFSLHMNPIIKNYKLFPAKRSGEKDMDMPQIQKKQQLGRIGMKNFFLEDIKEKKYGLHKKRRKISKQIGCFSLK